MDAVTVLFKFLSFIFNPVVSQMYMSVPSKFDRKYIQEIFFLIFQTQSINLILSAVTEEGMKFILPCSAMGSRLIHLPSLGL